MTTVIKSPGDLALLMTRALSAASTSDPETALRLAWLDMNMHDNVRLYDADVRAKEEAELLAYVFSGGSAFPINTPKEFRGIAYDLLRFLQIYNGAIDIAIDNLRYQS